MRRALAYSSLFAQQSVTVGGLACPVLSITLTTLTCTIPEGQGIAKAVAVNAGGQQSNSLLFSYAAPSLSTVSPANGPTKGGIRLTIVGTSLGTTGGAATVDNVACALVSQNHSQVVCTLPPGSGINVQVSVLAASMNQPE